ncbi:hypothetical protein [Paracidovorax valerianellae]|uniref:hypothetical protein n=1 Tax=Paracidovorax valerianellae TaxID=187868 RepID=UPI00230427AA|nr:hypothetical protein [Paracidovorax valerianellae]MDA8447837.1 hypothetical protein [Paracidovorax valerianellae]
MNKTTFNDKWNLLINEKLELKKHERGGLAGYPGVMEWIKEKGGRFSGWNLLAMPAGAVEDDLDNAITIACVYPTHEYAKTFLAWANEAADRALSDIRFTYDPDEERAKRNPDPLANRGWKIPRIFPGNHGSTLAAACFARAMRNNDELDNASLLTSCDEIAESALDTTSREWSDIPQSDYLRCVRLALIAGRLDKAQAFFKNCRRKFKFTQDHYIWLYDLCKAIEAAKGDELNSLSVEEFQRFFDQVRNPAIRSVGDAKLGKAVSTNISLLRLELALIKQKYICRQKYGGEWENILKLISE